MSVAHTTMIKAPASATPKLIPIQDGAATPARKDAPWELSHITLTSPLLIDPAATRQIIRITGPDYTLQYLTLPYPY